MHRLRLGTAASSGYIAGCPRKRGRGSAFVAIHCCAVALLRPKIFPRRFRFWGLAIGVGIASLAGESVASAGNSASGLAPPGASSARRRTGPAAAVSPLQPADAVFFDVSSMGGTSNACTINAAVNVASITLQNGYTKIASTSGVGAAGDEQHDRGHGDFTAGSAAMQITGGLNISGGVLNAPSGTLQIGGAFTRTGQARRQRGDRDLHATGAVTHTFSSAALFNKMIFNDGLVAYWNLDEGAGLSRRPVGYANGLAPSASSFAGTVPTTVTFPIRGRGVQQDGSRTLLRRRPTCRRPLGPRRSAPGSSSDRRPRCRTRSRWETEAATESSWRSRVSDRWRPGPGDDADDAGEHL